MTERRKDKTLYFLGAGFSMGVNAPSQAEILSRCLELHGKDSTNFDEGSVDMLRQLLRDHFLMTDDRQIKSIALEDIFTALDKALSEKTSFRGLTPEEIAKNLENLIYLIGKTIDCSITEVDADYLHHFANHVITLSKTRANRNYKRTDPVSIISANWDIALDKEIHRQLQDIANEQNGPTGVVDYCCHVSSYESADQTIKPGLEALGEGGFNVKLLKIHGSLNWLQCRLCGRLYVSFDEKIALTQNANCRHCKTNFNRKHPLQRNAIMPTFLKDFSNPQYKIIWQNAGIEISESSRIVFIGYSLPQADFEIRQLLSRMVRDDAHISVVTFAQKSNDSEYISLQSRYKNFFGSRNIEFHEKGAADYVKSSIAS